MTTDSSRLEQAQEHFQSGNFQAALSVLEQALQDEPDDSQLLTLSGLCLQRLGRASEGVTQLAKASEQAPADAEIQYLLASAQLDLGQTDPARHSIDRCLKADPNHLRARTLLGHIELRRQHPQAAANCFQAALRIDPDYPLALTGLAMALLGTGQPELARSNAERAASLDPNNAMTQIALARSYQALGHDNFAEQCLRNAASLHPRSGQIWGSLGALLGKTGQHREAIDAFKRALRLGVDTNRIRLGLASCQQQLGQLHEAHDTVVNFLAEQPDQPVGLALMVEILLDLKRTDQAAALLERLLKIEQGPRVTLLRARVAEARQDHVEAHALASELHQQSDQELADAARLLSGRVARARGTAVAARKALQPLIDAGRHEPTASWLLADTIAAGGHVERAREVLERLVGNQMQVTPAVRARTARRLAMLLDRAGEHAEADRHLELPGWRNCDLLARLAQDSPADVRAAWNQPGESLPEAGPIDDGRPDPIFVLGWPGSGRDLLLSVLEEQGELVMLDPAREKVRREALGLPLLPRDIPALDEGRIRLARKRFFSELRGQRLPDNGGVVDSGWWEVTSLPALARFFPGATVLVPWAETPALEYHWLLAGYRDIDTMLSAYREERQRFLRLKGQLKLNFIELAVPDLVEAPGPSLAPLGEQLGVGFSAQLEQRLGAGIADSPYAAMQYWSQHRQRLASAD
jgi:Tfp pilus assembly protein PilF